MSEESTIIGEKHFMYIAERTAKEDAFLISLKTAAKKERVPPIWIAPEQASFMQVLLKLHKAKIVIEVGTLAGYSAIWMARALPKNGKLSTIEINRKFAEFARKWIEKSDVADRIDVINSNGKEALTRFVDNSADAMFLDADKASYPDYMKEGLRILRPGGLLMADNAFAFGELFLPKSTDRETDSMRRFNDIIAQEKRLHGVIIPLGDGLWVSVKSD